MTETKQINFNYIKKKLLIKIKNNLNQIIILLLIFFNYYLYYLSLEKCLDGFDICGEKSKWIVKKLSQAIISYLILTILLELIILNKISKYHIFHIIIIYSFFYYYSHGLDFHDHGYFNFLGGITIISLLLLAFLPFIGIIFLIKKNKIYISIYIAFLIIIFIIYIYIANSYMNCNDWEIGLNNTYIDNNKKIHGCAIQIPKFCPYKLGKYVFDFTRWKGLKCSKNKENTKEKLIQFTEKPYININTKRIGFPLVNKDPELLLNAIEHNNTIKKYIKNNLVDMDNIQLVEKIYKENKPELIVDYTKNPYGEIIIDLKFNKTLSEERKKLENNVSIPYAKNIILLYIDSVSRAYSMRQLKKTLKFIEQFMPYKGKSNQNFKSDNFHSFQFLKYHSFKGYTFKNYPKIFYGNEAGSNIIRITKYFKENGYVTSYSNEMCLRELTVTKHNMKYEEIGDHELILCDPNRKHANLLVKKCLYNKLTISYLYEYGNQFWRKYKNNHRFLIIASNDGHEGTLEVLKYLDNILFTFLNGLFNDNLLKDTTIFLLSDHGTAMPSPYYMTNFFQREKYLPMLYIICNDRKNISYNKQYQFIYKNQQILITGYDIYNTLGNLLYGDEYEYIKNKTNLQDTPKSKYGISLFNEIKTKIRKPKKYNDNINKMVLNICI